MASISSETEKSTKALVPRLSDAGRMRQHVISEHMLEYSVASGAVQSPSACCWDKPADLPWAAAAGQPCGSGDRKRPSAIMALN